MVGFNGNLLFNKQFNGFLTKMDDSTSMVSLALRDGVESSGRTVMEYKRDKHGGRERLIEEGATMLIWAFGINWMKNLYDWGAKDILKKIDLPDLNTALLKAPQDPGKQTGIKAFWELLNPPSAQTLVQGSGEALSDNTQKFTKQFTNVEAYQKLSNIAASQGKKYAKSNMGKFLFATGIPVAAIAFGIPSFNQWFTRKKLEQEPKGHTAHNHPAPLPTAGGPKPKTGSPFAGRTPMPVSGFSAFPTQAPSPYAFSAGPSNPFAPRPLGAPLKMGTGANVQFSGNPLADGAAALLQNERMNTLLVDGVISGGRIAKARNGQEKVEIMFREGSIIAFLYFGQRMMQNFMTQKLKGGSELNFDTTRFLNSTYVKTGDQAKFFEHFKTDRENLESLLKTDLNQLTQAQSEKEGLKFWQNLFTQNGRKKIGVANKSAYQIEKKLVEQIQEYFLHNPGNPKNPNLIFETAKECGWIPTFDGKETAPKTMGETVSHALKNTGSSFKNKFQFLTSSGEEAVKTGADRYLSPSAAGKALNITKKIDTEAILSFAKHMNDVIEHDAKSKAPQALEKLMKQAVNRRGLAWLLSNGICTVFLSYIIPKGQHYLTYKMTGKDYFPGIQK
ncbi:hypothetical protein [Vampirovibrio sp.]|uniref:hypothetical protein n=1 Tax=Vampirovibrio sp. TaxID=2717857 RepID=UPI003593265F